jgi:hypothetical protein
MGAKPIVSRFDRARFIRLRSGQQQQREQKHHLSLSPDAARHSLRAARDAVRHDAYPARRTGRGRRSRARKARERRPRTPRISAHRVLGTRRNARGASIDRVGRHDSVARVDPRRGGRAARRVHRGAVPRGVARPRARAELGSRVHRGALRPRSRPRRAHARFTRSLSFFMRSSFELPENRSTRRDAATRRSFDGTRRASWGLTRPALSHVSTLSTLKRIPGGAPAAARAGFRAARGRRRRRRRRRGF